MLTPINANRDKKKGGTIPRVNQSRGAQREGHARLDKNYKQLRSARTEKEALNKWSNLQPPLIVTNPTPRNGRSAKKSG
jgi:hypothetical protein